MRCVALLVLVGAVGVARADDDPPPAAVPVYVAPEPAPAALPDLYSNHPLKLVAHILPPLDASETDSPVLPFGTVGISAELAINRYAAFEAGAGYSNGLQLAAFAHVRVPMVRFAPGAAVGLSRGSYMSGLNPYDCHTAGIFNTTQCDYAVRAFDSASWAHFLAELEFRSIRAPGLSVRVSLGVATLLTGDSTVACSGTSNSTCMTAAPDAGIEGSLVFGIGYAFGL